MSDLYEAAKKRLAAIREEERYLNEFLLWHDRARKILGSVKPQPSLFDDAQPAAAHVLAPVWQPSEPVLPEPGKAKKPRVTDNPPSAEVVSTAISILRVEQRPMSRRQLHEALEACGTHVRGADPVKTLGTILWRASDRIVQLEGYGYWPRDDHYDPAGYVPDPKPYKGPYTGPGAG